MMISIKEAKNISIAKWRDKLELDNNLSDYLEKYPNLSDYYNCGFCYRHEYKSDNNIKLRLKSCEKCELAKTEALKCNVEESLYNRIIDYEDDGEDITCLVDELLYIIENIPEDE